MVKISKTAKTLNFSKQELLSEELDKFFYDISFSSNIEDLSISDTEIKTLENIPIINHINKLRLWRTGVNLKGIENFKGLKDLVLHSFVEDSISELASISTLESLRLSTDKNITLNTSLSFPSLTSISMSNISIQDKFFECPDLEKLELFEGSLRSISWLKNFPKLKSLYIHSTGEIHESFKGELSEILGSMSQLKSITIQSLKVPDIDLHNKKKLEVLQIINEIGIEETITNISVKNCPLLYKLSIINSGMTSLAAINNCDNLIFLKLDDNRLESLIGIDKFPKLMEISIKNNLLKDFTGMSFSPFINRLDLSNNLIESFKGLPYLPSLTALFLISNKIEEVKELYKTEFLKILKISDNVKLNLSEIPSLNHLELLVLSENSNQIPEKVFNLKNIRVIRFDSGSLRNREYIEELKRSSTVVRDFLLTDKGDEVIFKEKGLYTPSRIYLKNK